MKVVLVAGGGRPARGVALVLFGAGVCLLAVILSSLAASFAAMRQCGSTREVRQIGSPTGQGWTAAAAPAPAGTTSVGAAAALSLPLGSEGSVEAAARMGEQSISTGSVTLLPGPRRTLRRQQRAAGRRSSHQESPKYCIASTSPTPTTPSGGCRVAVGSGMAYSAPTSTAPR